MKNGKWEGTKSQNIEDKQSSKINFLWYKHVWYKPMEMNFKNEKTGLRRVGNSLKKKNCILFYWDIADYDHWEENNSESASRSWQCKRIWFSAVPYLTRTKTPVALPSNTPKDQPWRCNVIAALHFLPCYSSICTKSVTVIINLKFW